MLFTYVYIHFLSPDSLTKSWRTGTFSDTSSFQPAPNTRLNTLHPLHSLESMCPLFLWSVVHIPCMAATPLKNSSPFNCYLPSSHVASCTPTYAHLNCSSATLIHCAFTIQGSAPGFSLLNIIIFSDPVSLWIPLLATEFTWIKLGLYVNLDFLQYFIRNLRSGVLPCFFFSSSL